MVPLSGKNAYVGNSIIKSVKLAINKINNDQIEVFPKDTKNDPKEDLNIRLISVLMNYHYHQYL